MGWHECFRYSAEAGGPVRLSELARVSGLSPDAVRARAAREGWWRPYPDVVGAPGIRVDHRAWAIAAALHARGRTGRPDTDVVAVTRWSAMALLGLRRVPPTRVEVAIPAHRCLTDRPRLTVVRSRLLAPSDVRDHHGVPLVTGTAIVRDLAPVTDVAALRAVIVDLLQRRETTLTRLEELVALHRCFPGRPAIRRILDELERAGRTDSPFEFVVRERLVADGVPLDRGQVAVPLTDGGTIHVDLGIAALRFGIELDSMGWHAARDQLDRDAVRANAVVSVADDWRLLHLTWTLMTERWDEFVAQVRTVVAHQAQRHLGVPWPRPRDLRT